MNAQIRPECLILNLFSDKDNKISIDSLRFYSFFYEQREDPEFKDLFTDIRFCGSPASPYSNVLDDALFNLQFIGALTRENPELVTYVRTEKFIRVYEHLTKDLDDSTKKKLKKLSKKYQNFRIPEKICLGD